MQKKIFLTLLLLLALLPFGKVFSATIGRPVVNAGLIGYWPFEDGNGSLTAYDRSGNGNTGTLTGTVVATTSNTSLGEALYFDGGNDHYVSINSTDSLNISSFITISFWVKPDSATNTDGTGLLCKGDGGGSEAYCFDISGGEWRFFYRTGGTPNIVTSASSVTTNWTFVVATYDGATQKMYINGVLENSIGGGGGINTNLHAVSIGSRQSASGSYNLPFKGKLDDVRIYNRALSADEIKRLYNAQKVRVSGGVSNTGLVGYWKLDEGSGTVAGDSSGNGYSGTLISSPAWISGKIGGALHFDGATNYVNLGLSPNPDGYSGLTISAWVNIDLPNQDSKKIVTKSVASYNEIWLGIGQNGSNLGEPCMTEGDVTAGWLCAPSPISTKTWHHIVSIANASGRWLYVDGALAATDSTAYSVTTTGETWDIGSNSVGSGSFPGSIDDVRIYNRALSATEVYNLYKGSKATVIDKTKTNRLTDGLVEYWTFDGKDSYNTTVNDIVGGNNGTITGAITPSPGAIGQALHFGDDTTYKGVDAGTSPSPDGYSALSISAWVKLDSSQSNTSGIIVAKTNGSFQNVWLTIGENNIHTNEPCMTDGSSGDDWLCSPSTISYKAWHHIVSVINGSGRWLYVDGALVANDAGVYFVSTAGDPWTIGSALSDRHDIVLNGSVDDVRVYNRTLSQTDVTALYNMGK